MEEASWKNECDVYQTPLINHENILRTAYVTTSQSNSLLEFVAADISGSDNITQMLLITNYHPCGSLHDYLRREQTLSVREAIQLALRYDWSPRKHIFVLRS